MVSKKRRHGASRCQPIGGLCEASTTRSAPWWSWSALSQYKLHLGVIALDALLTCLVTDGNVDLHVQKFSCVVALR